jgi:hypothetical protein
MMSGEIEAELVMPGLVPGIQPTASAGARSRLDRGDKRPNDRRTIQ